MKRIGKNNISERVAKLLLKLNVIALRPKNPFKFTSGILSPVYTDCRIIISHPKERQIIRDLYIKIINSSGKKFDVIAGTATAGIPHAAWVAEKLKLPLIYIRGKAKEHGKKNQIEGILKKNQKVAIIEDLISTGGSSIESAKAIRNAKGKASDIFSIITYGMKKSLENFTNNKIKLNSLTNFTTVVDVAEKTGYIKMGDKKLILEWANDPSSWGEKMGFEK